MTLDEFRKKFESVPGGIFCNSVFERNEALRFLERSGYVLGRKQKRYITTNDPDDNSHFLHPIFNGTAGHISCCWSANQKSFIMFDDIHDLIYGEDEDDDQVNENEIEEALLETLCRM